MREGGVTISAETIGGGTIQIASFMTFYLSHPIRKHSRKDIFAMRAKQLRCSWFVQFEFKEILFYFVLKCIQRRQYFGLPRKDFLLETVVPLIIYKGSHGMRSPAPACLDILGQLVWRQGIFCLAGGEGSESLGGSWGVRRGVRFLGTGGVGGMLKVGMCSYKHR